MKNLRNLYNHVYLQHQHEQITIQPAINMFHEKYTNAVGNENTNQAMMFK